MLLQNHVCLNFLDSYINLTEFTDSIKLVHKPNQY